MSPMASAVPSVASGRAAGGVTGKIGPGPSSGTRTPPATTEAQATGMKLRGFHSNSSNSTASSTAATGVANTADMPPRGSRDEQRLAFGGGEVERLREQRAE